MLHMDEQQQIERQIAAVADFLQRRNATLNSASQRWRLDRNTFTKFSKGGRISEAWIEKFATATDEDLDYWLKMTGHKPDLDSLAEQLIDSLEQAPDNELTYEPDFSHIRVDGYEGVEGIDPHDVEILNEVARTVAARIAKRKQQGKG